MGKITSTFIFGALTALSGGTLIVYAPFFAAVADDLSKKLYHGQGYNATEEDLKKELRKYEIPCPICLESYSVTDINDHFENDHNNDRDRSTINNAGPALGSLTKVSQRDRS